MTYAVVTNGIVDNIVVWDGSSDWMPPIGSVLVEIAPNEWCSIGTIYREGEQPRFIAAGE